VFADPRLGFVPDLKQTKVLQSVSLIPIDEAARVQDEMYRSLRLMPAVGGDLCAMSTPCGQRGFSYETWQGGGEWMWMSVSAMGCERNTEEFLDKGCGAADAACFPQEYLCGFCGGWASDVPALGGERCFG
jgi:hypothetical protein